MPRPPLSALRMKCASIVCAASRCEMTPSRRGSSATTPLGVRPSISFAAEPTASTAPVALLKEMTEGSFSTTPRPRA